MSVEVGLGRGQAELIPGHVQVCLERKPNWTLKGSMGRTWKTNYSHGPFYLWAAVLLYLHQLHASAAHLSWPIIFAHCGLRRAVSEVGLAGVDW